MIGGGDFTWLPRKLGFESWWSAANPNGNTTNIPSDGSSLALLYDLGLNGNHFIQNSASNQPVFKLNIVNGQNVIRLTTSSYMQCAASANNSYSGPVTVVSILCSVDTSSTRQVISKNASWASSMIAGGNFLFTTIGIKDYTTASATFPTSTFLIKIDRFNADKSVDFFKNRGSAINITGTTAMTASNTGLVFGSVNPVFSWKGDFVAGGVAFNAFPDSKIAILQDYVNAMIGL